MTKILVVVLSDQTSAEMSPKCFQKPIKNVNQNFDASVADPLEKRSFPKNRRYKGQCLTEFNKIFRVSFCYRYKGVGYFCFDELFSAETFMQVCLYDKGLYTSYFSLRVSYFDGIFDYSSYFIHATFLKIGDIKGPVEVRILDAFFMLLLWIQ